MRTDQKKIVLLMGGNIDRVTLSCRLLEPPPVLTFGSFLPPGEYTMVVDGVRPVPRKTDPDRLSVTDLVLAYRDKTRAAPRHKTILAMVAVLRGARA